MIFEIDDIVSLKDLDVAEASFPLLRIYEKKKLFGKKKKLFGRWVYSLEEYNVPPTRRLYRTNAYGPDLTLVRRGDPCDCDPTKKFKPKCLDCVLKRFP